jgi:hypothetical protein
MPFLLLVGCSSHHTLNVRTIILFCSTLVLVWKANPSEDRLHIESLFDLTSKSIQRLFTKPLPQTEFVWSGEFVKRPCSAKELMAEIVVIEKSVQIGSEDARIGAHAPIVVAA